MRDTSPRRARASAALTLALAATLVAARAEAQDVDPVGARGGKPTLALPPPTPGSTEPLSLDAVVLGARSTFPTMLAARAAIDQAYWEARTAAGAFDPTLRVQSVVTPIGGYPSIRLDTQLEQPTPLWGASVVAGYRLGVGSFPVYDGKLETNDLGELRAGLRVPLLRDGSIDRRRATLERAKLGEQIARLDLSEQGLGVTRVASHRYWDWVAAGERLGAVRTWLSSAEERDRALEVRAERGDLAPIESLENKRTVLQRRATLTVAERLLEQARIELSLYRRARDGSPSLPTVGELPGALPSPDDQPLDPATLARGALSRRPEPRKLELAVEQLRVEQRLADNQRLPALDFAALVSTDLGCCDEKRGKPVVEAGLLFDVPIPGRALEGRARAAAAAVRRGEAVARLARDRVVAEVRDAVSAVEAARQRAELALSEAKVAERLEALERKRFESGDSTLLIVNLREQATLEARVRAVESLADYHKAKASLRAAEGRE
jgi:cobalt-zinc-cadmium efflux system outer membrane protein